MDFLWKFMRQKAPGQGSQMPAYYRKALAICESVLLGHFLIVIAMFGWACRAWSPVPIVLTAALMAFRLSLDHARMRVELFAYALITLAWCTWCVCNLGWSAGSQHLLIPVLTLCFFNICEPPPIKVLYFLGLVAFRMGLFYYSLLHAPAYALEQGWLIAFQTVSSLTIFIMLSLLYVVLSISIQDTERQLLIDNQELHKEAGTDPLTELPNRRALMDEIDRFFRETPDGQFSVAIADIDFFKKVNDTYGHNCGDYTLKELSALFRESAGTDYKVCRWGGEEFCFFMPGKNLDAAGTIMFELTSRVRKMPLHFGGNDFSITITIGVAENDFISPINAILEQADQKLYMGKIGGRDQVVL